MGVFNAASGTGHIEVPPDPVGILRVGGTYGAPWSWVVVLRFETATSVVLEAVSRPPSLGEWRAAVTVMREAGITDFRFERHRNGRVSIHAGVTAMGQVGPRTSTQGVIIMPKKSKDELLKGMHRGRGNHLDAAIVSTHEAVTETHGLRAKFEVSIPLLLASMRAATDHPKEVQLELISDFEKNLGPWLDMHGL